MSDNELALQEKKELASDREPTAAGKYYVPQTDIYESGEAVIVAMDVPGVDRSALDIELDKNVLTVTAKIDPKKYDGLEPLYAEYNVGNFSRSFTVSTKIDADGIDAKIVDGVLTVQLPKAKEVQARRINVG